MGEWFGSAVLSAGPEWMDERRTIPSKNVAFREKERHAKDQNEKY